MLTASWIDHKRSCLPYCYAGIKRYCNKSSDKNKVSAGEWYLQELIPAGRWAENIFADFYIAAVCRMFVFSFCCCGSFIFRL